MLRLTSDLNTQARASLHIDLWLVRSVLAVQSCNLRCQLAHVYLCPLKQLGISKDRQLLGGGVVQEGGKGRASRRPRPVTRETGLLGEL